MTTTFTPKDPAEAIFYGIDFSALLEAAETVSSATVSIRATVMEDSNATALLSGNAVIEANIIKQKIVGGLPGNTYRLAVSVVTNLGQTFVEAQDIAIIAET